MKSIFKKIGASFLLLLFVGGSLGVTVSKMTCLMSGKSMYAFGDIQDCCPPVDSDVTTVTGHCCEFSHYDYSTDLPFIQNKISDDQDVKAPSILPGFLANAVVIIDEEQFRFSDASPPDIGPPLYLLHEVFLI